MCIRDRCDFVYVCGDAYVDHPSFGSAIISRVLESYGYKVGIIAQPDWKDKELSLIHICACRQRNYVRIRSWAEYGKTGADGRKT